MENNYYQSFIEVYETGRYEYCNEFIKLGWVLINTYVQDSVIEGQTLIYVLAWPKENGNEIQRYEPYKDIKVAHRY